MPSATGSSPRSARTPTPATEPARGRSVAAVTVVLAPLTPAAVLTAWRAAAGPTGLLWESDPLLAERFRRR